MKQDRTILVHYMLSMPIVRVMDDRLMDKSCKSAKTWRAPTLVADEQANTKHGNQMTSLI